MKARAVLASVALLARCALSQAQTPAPAAPAPPPAQGPVSSPASPSPDASQGPIRAPAPAPSPGPVPGPTPATPGLAPAPAPAAPAAAPTAAPVAPSTPSEADFIVGDIRVEGLQRVSEGTVYNYLPVNIGDHLTTARVREAIRALYATGFFRDVQLRRDGNAL
ncbi:MAG TPA: POTRA domain-containing protein, partial [Steroidobacteraceae bacterium]|nr:POTRA domain-containing protein [Steroidobacteraceae bacterium]